MKKYTAISCLAIFCLLFPGINGHSQSTSSGLKILKQPAFNPVCAGEGTTFHVQASGSGLTYQWQVFKRWGNYENLQDTMGYSGSRTPQLTISSLSEEMNQYSYRCVIRNGTDVQYTRPAVVELKNAIINIQPANGTGYVGDYHSIEVYATGQALAFQWQVNSGSGFENIEDDDLYKGSKTRVLSIPEVAKKMDGYQYRCIVTGKACETTTLVSTPATLTISSGPNPLKSMMSGNPDEVIWYMDGLTQELTFFGNPEFFINGALQVVNDAQILSQTGTGPSSNIYLTGHLKNDNPDKTLLTEGDISQFIFTGGDAQEIQGGDATRNNFYKIKIDKSSSTLGLTLNNDISFRGNLEFATGDLKLNSHDAYFNYVNSSFDPQALADTSLVPFPTILNETDDNRIVGSSGSSVWIVDQLVANQNPFINGLHIGNIGVEITDPINNFASKNITIERAHEPLTNGGETSIQRSYKISSDPDTPVPVEMDFTFHYLDADLAGVSESNLTVFKSDDNGATWVGQTATLNTTNNTLTQYNLEDINTLWTTYPCVNGPNITLPQGPVLHLCDGTTTILTPSNSGGPITSYEWFLDGVNTGVTTSSYTVTGMEGTPNQSLLCKVYNADGCFSESTLTLIHEDAISVDLGDPRSYCEGEYETFTVSVPNATDYVWEVDGVLASSGQGLDSTFLFIANYYTPGPHTLTVTAYTPYCSTADTVVLTVNENPTASLPFQLRKCEPGTTLLDANPAGGALPYDFNWHNGASTQQITVNNQNTTFSVTVTDANDCSAVASMPMCYSNLELSETHTNIACFGEATGEIDLTVTGTFEYLQFSWSNDETTEDLTGLTAGIYTVTVTDATVGCSGDPYCSESLTVTLDGPESPLSGTGTVTHILCHGQNTGAIDLSVSGGSPAYTYTWSNGATTQDLINLVAGTYNVTVTDANLCTATAGFVVSEPPLLGSASPLTVTGVSCNGAGDGEISVTITGGVLPYTYSWTGPGGFTSTDEDLLNIDGGTYNLTVTDNNNCTFDTSIVVPEPDELTAILTPSHVSCVGNNDGSITLAPAGGTSPFEYSWTGPNGFTSTQQNISSLEPGDYNVTISDDNECTFIPATVTILEPASPLSVSGTITNITCFGAHNGTITTTTTGGWPPYTYSWLDPDDEDLPATPNQNSLGPGVHELVLFDSNNCYVIEYFDVEEPDEIILNETVTQISCHNANDGSIALAVTGGTGGYMYNWQWAGGSSSASSLSNLAAGTYAVTVTDDNNCTKTGVYDIINPAAISATAAVSHVSCYGYNNGQIVLTPAGGTPGYTFSWTGPNGFTSSDNSINFLEPGIYNVTVSDANSCPPFTNSYTITEPTQVMVAPSILTPLLCYGDSNAVLLSNPGGGTPPYTYLWIFPDGTEATTQNISNLSQPGFYTISVWDNNGCASPGQGTTIELTSPQEIITSGVVTDVSVNGGSDGAIDLTASGGTGTLAYAWSNGATTEDLTGLMAGTYIVTVSDDNSCEKLDTFIVDEPAALAIVLDTLIHVTCFGGSDGEIETYATGGVGYYTYDWSNGGSSPAISNLIAGNYTLTVTDDNGAMAIETFTVTEPDTILPNAILVNVSCNGGSDGSITLNPTGGMGTYIYVWSTQETTNAISGLTAGGYDVTITDENGCQVFSSFTITEPDLLTSGNTPMDASCYGYDDGSIELTPAGGTSPYSYNWNNGVTTGSGTGTTISNLYAGTYDITVTDDHGCTATTSATVGEPPSQGLAITGDAFICAGESSTLDAGAGFTDYSWSTGETTQTIMVSTSNTYLVTVTGTSGCTETDDFEVTVNPLPTLVIDSLVCSPDLSSYDVHLTSNAPTVTTDYGTVTNNGNGTYTVSDVPAGQDVTITAEDNICDNEEIVTAPVCSCPVVNEPVSNGDEEICNGEAIPALSVMVNADETADWYDSATGGTLLLAGSTTYTASAAGTYYAEARNTINGCISSTRAAVALTIHPLPVAAAGDDVDICLGSSTQLDAGSSSGSGTLTFTWSPTSGLSDPSIANPVADPTATTTYTLIVTDANTCSASDDVTVTVNDLPSANAGNDVAICLGESTQLDAGSSSGSGTLSYAWSPTTGLSDPNIVNPIADPAATTTYTVIVTDDNGCTDSDQVTVTVNPLPTLVFNDTICSPDLLSYDVLVTSNADDLTADYGTVINNNNGTFTIEDIPGGQDVTLTATLNATGCVNTLVVSAPFCACPPVDPPFSNGNQIICDGESIPALSVTVGANETADWYDAPTGGILLLAGNTTYTPSGAGTFYAEARNTINGCVSSTRTALALIVNPLPTANAGSDVGICIGSSTQLDAGGSSGSGNLNYVWSPTTGLSNPNIVNPVADPSVSTTYTVTVTDANGCSASDEVLVTVNDLPIANAGDDADICYGGSTQLNAGGSTGTGTLSYEWSPNYALSNHTIVDPLAYPLVPSITYTVEVTDGNGCTDTDEVVVTVHQPPTLTLDSATCAPNLLTYDVAVTSNADELSADYGTVTNNNNGTFTITGVPAGQNVNLTATNNTSGCQKTLLVTAPNCNCPVIADPVSNGNQSVCTGEPITALMVMVNANETADWYDAASGGNLLLAGNTSYTPSGAGTYYAEARNTVNNCISDNRTAVTLSIHPVPVANAGADAVICSGSTTQLDAGGSTGSGSLSYAWSPATGLNNLNIVNPVASPTATTTYTVEITDANGCTDTDEVVITVNPVPTLVLDDTICAPNLLTYHAFVTSDADELTANYGIVANNNNGTFTITGVSAGQNVTLTATFIATGCQKTLVVAHPDCSCPVVTPPVSNGNQSVCIGNPVPALSVTVNADETADWYDAASGGTLLLSGNTSYTPATAGTYYAEARNTINQCISSTRTAVTLTINPLPTAAAGDDAVICRNSSTQLDGSASSGSGALTFAWSPGTGLNYPNIVNPVASPTVTTTYTLSVTDSNGCTDTDQVVVTVNPLPTLAITDTVCAPDLLTYTAFVTSNANELTADHGTVTNNGNGTFTVTAVPAGQNVTLTATFNASGCQRILAVPYPDCSCPIVNAPVSSGNESICAGEPIPALTVSVNADETADWYDAASGGTLLLSGSTSYTPTGAGTYYAEARNTIDNCISSTRTPVVLTINPLPVAAAGDDVTICAGVSTQLDAGASSGNGALTYLWSPATGLNNPNIVNPVASPSTTTTYTVAVTDANGCSNSDQVTVTVNPLPAINILSTACAPDLLTYEVELTTTGDDVIADYGTVIDNGGGSFTIDDIPEGQNILITATFTATGCEKTQNVSAPDCNCPTVNAPFSNGDEDICTGEAIPALGVSVDVDQTADWYDAPVGGTLLLSGNTSYTPSGAGTYYAEARDLTNGCVSSTRTPVTLTINPVPVANAGADVTICAGNGATLNAGASSGSGILTYVWTPAIGLSDPNIVNPVATPSSTTTYTVEVTDENGCMASDEIVVSVNDLPTANSGVNDAICPGASTMLDASGSSGNGTLSYLWSPAGSLDDPTGVNPVATPAVTTTYTVVITDGNSCSQSDQVTVTVHVLPIANAGPDVDICTGSNTQLNASGSSASGTLSYLWSPAAGLSNPNIADPVAGPMSTTTYTVLVADGNGCENSDQVTVTVNDLPTAAAGADATICFGTGTQLDASASSGSGSLTYEWSPATGLNNPNIASPVASPTSTTTYTVIVTDGNSCSAADQVTVTVNDLPVTDAGADVAICTGSTTQLDAGASSGNGILSFQWSPAAGLSATNIANPVASPLTTTTYTVVVTDSNSCSENDQVTVMVNPLPTLSVTDTVCAPNLLTYDGLVSSNADQLLADYGTVTNNNNGTFSITGIPAGQNVNLTAINATTGCQKTGVMTHPDCSCPVVTAPVSNGNQAFCTGSSMPALSVTVGADETADWYSSAAGGTLLLSGSTSYTPAAVGTYYAEARNTIHQCTSSIRTAVMLTMNPLPSAIAGANGTICAGESKQLNAGGSSGANPLTFAWSPATGLNNANIVNPMASPAVNTTYTVTVTDGNGCTDTDQLTVTVNPLPTITVIDTVCATNLLTYTATVQTNGDDLKADQGILTNNGGGSYTISDVPAGQNLTITAYFTITDCTFAIVLPAPDCNCPMVAAPVSNGNQTICDGTPIPALSVTVNANETADWYDAPTGGNLLLAGNTSYTPPAGDTYYAEARNTINGCLSDTRTAVTLTIHPPVIADAGPDKAFCVGGSTQLDAGGSTGTGPLTFLWSPATGLSDPTIANPVATPGATTTYTVTVTDANGCSDTDQALVVVNALPNITVNNANCHPSLLTYYVYITTNADQVTSTAGIVSDLGGGVFLIDNVPIGQDITVTATQSASGCATSQGVNSPTCGCPHVNPPVSLGDHAICTGEPIPTMEVSVGANQTADWYDAATGGTLLLSGNTSYTPSGAGTYYAEARNTINGCVSSVRTAVTLIIHPLPVADAGADVTTCSGTGAQLDASGSSGTGGLNYEWSPTTGLNDPTIANPVANPTNATIYTVAVTDGFGCSDTDDVMVLVDSLPTFTINQPTCSADLLSYAVQVSTNADSLMADAGTVTDNGNGSYTVSGIPAGQDVNLTFLNTSSGCTVSQVVTAPDCNCPTVATPVSNGDEEICEGEPILVLTVMVNANETADWYDAPAGGNLLLTGSISYTPTEAGIFYAEARDTTTGCTSDTRVAVTLTINPLPAIVFDDPADVCDGSDPVTLTASPTGGTFAGPGVSGDEFDPSSAGVGIHNLTYTFTGANGCVNVDTQDIEVLPLPEAIAGSNSPVCDGGDLMLTESGGDGNAWSWTGPNGFTSTEQNPVVSALSAAGTGIYEVTVTNADGCISTASVTVALNPALGLGISPDPADFCQGGSVQLVANATGGDGLFEYDWTTPSGGNESGQTVTVGEAGTWEVTVTDGSGCTIAESIAVSELPAILILFTSTNASCSSSDGSLTANVSGGIPPYTYEWDGLPNTTNMLTGVPAGNYQVIVTDDAGCTFSATGTVGNSDAPVIMPASIQDASCSGTATGSITVDISGGVLPYSFNWSNGATTQNISGLTSGQYVLEVTDAAGCIANSVFTIGEPPALLGSLVVAQTSSPTAGDGAIDLTASGGTPPYQYMWSNGLNMEDLTNLFIGPYSVTITDANGCSVVESTSVTAIGALTVNLNGQDISCNGGSDGSVVVDITGGFMPYSILWSTSSTDTIIENLLPGTYQVTVTDDNGSTVTQSTTLSEPNPLQAFTQQTDAECNGASDGSANVFPSGGTAPYTFEWSNGETTQAITGISAGDYTVTVTDDNGCTLQQMVTVGEPPAMLIAVDSITDNTCFGDLEGSIDISVSGGAFPYFANWSNGASTQDISGLAAGTYTVTITDFDNCTSTTDVVVAEGPEIVISFTGSDVSCYGEANGSLTANVSGGTPGMTGYQYNWNTGQTTASIANLISDNYFVTVTDEIGCTAVDVDFVAQPDTLLANLAVDNISCFGLADGSATALPTGGTIPYSYQWNTGATDSLIENLDVGAYSLLITDAAGCTTVETLQITQEDMLSATSTVTDLNCFNDFSGAIDLEITGGTPGPTGNYVVSWSSGQFTEDIDQLEAGSYLVTIADDNGCIIQDSITVNQPDAIAIAETVDPVSCFGATDGTIQLTVSGGNAPYGFSWQNGAVTPEITGLGAGSYTASVTDDHGCLVTASIEVSQPDLLSMDYQIQRAGCKTSDDGYIDLFVQGGVPGYDFNWSNGTTMEDATQLTAGTYSVTVTDDNGCTVSQSLGVGSTSPFEAHFLAASGLFDVDSVEVTPDDVIQFVDVSYPSPISWEWQFGDPDSTTSDVANPAFSYPNDESAPQTSYQATLIASNLYCTDSMTKTIWITNNFRLNEPQKEDYLYVTFTDVLAYPNPTSGLVTLDIKLSWEETVIVYLSDVLGSVLDYRKLEGDDHYTTQVDFSGMTPGIYFITLRSVNQVHTVKIVVTEE